MSIMGFRLLYVIVSVDPRYGGPLEGIRQNSLVNQREGHEIEVVSLDAPNAPFLRDFPFLVHPLGPSYTPYHFTFKLLPWFRVNLTRFDAVIVNGIWAYNCFGAWIALRGSGLPYFVYVHGMLDPWFKRKFPLKHFKKCLFWPWAVYPVLRDAAAVLFTCEEERRLARESFSPYKCNEVVVNYGTSGVPDSDFDYQSSFLRKFPCLENRRRFLFLGRVHPKKGLSVLISSFARALSIYGTGSSPDVGCSSSSDDLESIVLMIAGPVDRAYASELELLAETLGVSSRVVWLGMLSGGEKWGALQSAEVFLLPSYQENFGISVVESLSVGVPVLISTGVNIWREIVDADAGMASEPNVVSYSNLLTSWLQSSLSRKAAMSVNARELFLRRFTSTQAAKSLIENVRIHVSSDGN